jgi:hypothetical protein
VRARRIASVVLAALGCICVAAALVAGYVRTTVLDSEQFADRATSALQEPAVRDAIAREITDQAILRADRDLVAIRPLVETAAGVIVSTPAFRSLFHTAARDLHRTVFTRDRSTATLTIADVGVLLSGALRRLDPKAARGLPAGFAAHLSSGADAVNALDAVDYVDRVQALAWLSAIAAVLLLAGAIAVAPGRSRAVVHVGVAIAIAGGVVTLAYQLGRAELLARFPLPADRAAAGDVWDAFLSDLRMWSLVTLAAGTVIAAAAASLLRPVDVRRPLARAWAVVTTVPVTPWRRVARALALIAAGVLIVVQRWWMLDLALILAGVFVLYQGVEELLRMIAESSARRQAAARAKAGGGAPKDEDGEPVAAGPSLRGVAPWLAGGVAVLLIAVLVAALFGSGATRPAEAAAEVTTCNGRAELCDRPLDEVAFAGTHNSMSGYRDWLFVQQERGIRGQLDDGVHALMLDAYFGRKVGRRVLTELPAGRQDAARKELGSAGVDAGLRIRESLLGGDAEPGPRGVWMCHGFCELGAKPLVDGLREVTDFLVANPGEVLLIVVQDEGPPPAAIAKAVDESGLRPFVWTGPVGPPWPTLGEMIESGGRVLMLYENGPGDPAVPWYHDAYRSMQETPYHFTKPSQMSCAPNRGPADASLFLINHWIDTSPAPRPSNAAKVNAYTPLLERARRCERERKRMPNILAVDFYRTGELLRVTDTLNGFGPDAA